VSDVITHEVRSKSDAVVVGVTSASVRLPVVVPTDGVQRRAETVVRTSWSTHVHITILARCVRPIGGLVTRLAQTVGVVVVTADILCCGGG